MVTGPSIGPAMVLTVLMRWPALIAVCAVGGASTTVYNEVDMERLDDSLGRVASNLNITSPVSEKEMGAAPLTNAQVIELKPQPINNVKDATKLSVKLPPAHRP